MSVGRSETSIRNDVAEHEFSRVMHWLALWGYSLVDSDGQPVTSEQVIKLREFYAGKRSA